MFDLRQRVNGRPLLVGHRGAMAVAPENTFPAFEAGLAGGADILELDVQLSADGEVVVFHDTDLLAKTGTPGLVRDHAVDYLTTLDVGAWFDERFAGVRLPRLADVLAWARGRAPLMIELKHSPGYDARLNTAVVGLVADYGLRDAVVITSFDQHALRHVRALDPGIALSFIYVGRFYDPLRPAMDVDVEALSPATDFLTSDEVAAIQAAGYACSPGGFYWDYAELLAWGVDSISSNDPAAIDWGALRGPPR